LEKTSYSVNIAAPVYNYYSFWKLATPCTLLIAKFLRGALASKHPPKSTPSSDNNLSYNKPNSSTNFSKIIDPPNINNSVSIPDSPGLQFCDF